MGWHLKGNRRRLEVDGFLAEKTCLLKNALCTGQASCRPWCGHGAARRGDPWRPVETRCPDLSVGEALTAMRI